MVASPNTISVWDAANGKQLFAPLTAVAPVSSVQFDPLGRRLVTASSDRTARIWNATTGAALFEPIVHPAEVRWAGFSDDGGKLITDTYTEVFGSEDETYEQMQLAKASGKIVNFAAA